MRKNSRRDFLQLMAAALGGALLSACDLGQIPVPASTALPTATGAPAATHQPTRTPPASIAKPTLQDSATPAAKPRGRNATPAPVAAITRSLDSQILGRPTKESITVSLLSTSDRQVNVAYGVNAAEYTQRTGPVALKANIPKNIELAGLQADTGYFYQVQGSGAPHNEHSFHTQRVPGNPFVFTIEADPHSREPGFNGDLYAAALSNALADRPDFHINLGDTFMTEKRNPSTFAEAESTYTDLRPYFGILGADAPLFLVNGNHEGELGWLLSGKQKDLPVWSTQLRQRYYPNPAPNGFYTGSSSRDPILGSVRDGYYAWTWGDALFLILDPFWYTLQKPQLNDLAANWNWTLGREQYGWLKSTLESSAAKFKFVFIHHLVGGNQDGRGGIEVARFFEWGGQNLDGSDGFASHRPGWDKPIHLLLVEHGVNAVFHGHDHVFVKQDLNGIVYQELPQPSNAGADNSHLAADYGYQAGKVCPGSGHLRITVRSEGATVEFVRASLPADTAMNGQVVCSYIMVSR